MFRRTFAALHAAAVLLGLASKAPELVAAKSSEYPTPGLGSYQGSGGHRGGRGSGRRRGAPKGGISGAGLWRKCRAGGRVRGW